MMPVNLIKDQHGWITIRVNTHIPTATNAFLIGLKTHLTRGKSCLVLEI